MCRVAFKTLRLKSMGCVGKKLVIFVKFRRIDLTNCLGGKYLKNKRTKYIRYRCVYNSFLNFFCFWY